MPSILLSMCDHYGIVTVVVLNINDSMFKGYRYLLIRDWICSLISRCLCFRESLRFDLVIFTWNMYARELSEIYWNTSTNGADAKGSCSRTQMPWHRRHTHTHTHRWHRCNRNRCTFLRCLHAHQTLALIVQIVHSHMHINQREMNKMHAFHSAANGACQRKIYIQTGFILSQTNLMGFY